MKLLARQLMLTAMLLGNANGIAETVHVAIPGWSRSGEHEIEMISVLRYNWIGGIAHLTMNSTRRFTQPAQIKAVAGVFAGFVGAEELARARNVRPLFIVTVLSKGKEKTLYLGIERGVTYDEGMTNPSPSATVILWEKTEDGIYQEYSSRNFRSVQKDEEPPPVTQLRRLMLQSPEKIGTENKPLAP